MENRIVRKSNALVEASYKLTAQEQWIILFLTSMIKNHDEDFKDYSISIKDFSTLAGISHKGEYKEVQEITKKLIGRAFTINEPSGPLQIAWLSSAKYLKGDGTVTLAFDPKLKPYLLQLQNRFTKYNLHMVMQLKSSFSIRIYELLKQYENFKERSFFIKELREMLGIDPAEYPKYGNFKQKVLNVAQREIEEKTDLSFEYEEIKVGRCVGKIRFIINVQKRAQKTLPFPDAIIIPQTGETKQKPEAPELLTLLELVPKDFRKSNVEKVIRSAFEKFGFDRVMRNIAYTNEKSNAAKPGVNLAKGSNYRVYLTKALAGDFGLPYQEDKEIKQKAELEAKRKGQEEADAQKKRNDQAKREKEDHERARVYQQSLPPEAFEHLKEEALSRLAPEQQEMVKRKSIGAEMLLKIMMDKISLERMKIS